MTIRDLKQKIESILINFSNENEIDNMDVHVTIQKKVKCNISGSVLAQFYDTTTEINIK